MLRVTINNEAPIEDVIGWSTPGGRLLLLDFADGSTRGIGLDGSVDFNIERVGK